MNRHNIESIFPLLPTQEAFLWTETESATAAGSLQVSCELHGHLDHEKFQRAWDATVARHELLRASIHARADRDPMLVIWRKVSSPLRFHDVSQQSQPMQQTYLDDLLDAERCSPLPLDQAPVSRTHIIRWAPGRHRLVWSLHHALLDGWSTSLVLRECLMRYDRLAEPSTSIEPGEPCHYRDYLAWRKAADADPTRAQSFWQEHLTGFRGNPRLPDVSAARGVRPDLAHSVEKRVDETTAEALNAMLREQQVTPNAVAAGMWALTLSCIYQQEDVVFGTVAAGRSAPLDGIQHLVGLLANVIPLRVVLPADQTAIEWILRVRDQQFAAQQYEHTSLVDIESRLARDRSLVETLLVVEAFPSEGDFGRLRLRQFRSGIISAYPLTLCVVPEDNWTLRCYYHPSAIEEDQAQAIVQHMAQAMSILPTSVELPVGDFLQRLPRLRGAASLTQTSIQGPARTIVAPRNDVELQLQEIWEEVLGHRPISIRDDFFQIGGKSLTAMKLMTRVEEVFGKKCSPGALLENPTIEKFARQIVQGGQVSECLVRFNRRADDEPIICVHADAAHALYYRFLASHLRDYPVAGLHPKGLQGGVPIDDFTELAKLYLAEVQAVYGDVRYHLLGYCMGATVALEMARQLELAGREVGSLTIVDSGYYTPRSALRSQLSKHSWAVGFLLYVQYEIRKRLWHVRNLRLRLGTADDRQEYYRRCVERACSKAFREHRAQPASVSIQLLRSTQYSAKKDKDFHLDWQRLTTGEFSMELVDADHVSILSEPAVGEVAAMVSRAVERSRTGEHSRAGDEIVIS